MNHKARHAHSLHPFRGRGRDGGHDTGTFAPGFSIVELMVVIAVIAMLIALLMPSLSSARETARSVRCLANERQFAVAIAAYTSEHKDWWPIASYAFCGHTESSDPWYPANHNSPLWSGVVAHYANNRYITEFPLNATAYPQQVSFPGYANVPKPNQGILKCPSETFKNAWGCDLAVSYGYNSTWYGMGVNDFFVHHWSDVYHNPVYNDGYGRVRTHQVLDPDGTILLADEEQEGGYEYAGYHLYNGADDLATYHNGATNVLWVDGHATTRQPETLTPADFDRRL